jgi:hypothetical protein
MTTRYWSDKLGRFVECAIAWNGTLARQDEQAYSLVGDHWHQKEAPYQKTHGQKPADGSLITQQEAREKLPAADVSFVRRPTAPPVRSHCGGCGWMYPPSELTAKLKLCPSCRVAGRRALGMAHATGESAA